ncbi:MAG TPA: hypothetical protein HPQ03_01945 [Deltaproteobacteria bacterium]|nr:hypothetical protein [Deltaproteobacteria bacterium]
MERSIIHINVADFAVAVERMVDSRLKTRPVIIAPKGTARAVVYDMSEEAYQIGVRKGMALRKAARLCRGVNILPPHPDRYEGAMRALLKQALPYSPLIEPGDRDGHLFVDVTGTNRLFGPPIDIAWRLRKRIKTDLSFDPTWSVASNKLIAKVATRLVKPTGEYIVGQGEEEKFLAPLPIRLIPGIDRNDLLQFEAFNLTRVYQVSALSLEHLQVPFGNRAPFLYEAVRGIDPSPVLPVRQKKPTVLLDHDFGDDTNDVELLNRALYGLVERGGKNLRDQRLAARSLCIVLDYSDGIRHVRRAVAQPATSNDLMLFEAARQTLMRAWTRRIRIRHIGLIFDKLIFPPAQLELFPENRRKTEKRTGLIQAVDKIRDRFGKDAIHMGRMLAA